jgi:hypothetical protein
VAQFPAGAKDFSLVYSVQTGFGTHPTSHPVGTGGSFSGVEWQEREDDHSPISRIEVSNGKSIRHVR